MRLLLAVIALSLITVDASAQVGTTPAGRFQRPVIRPLHIGPPPPVHSAVQRALAVQRLLHLPFAPTLTQTITLDARRPFYAGVAELDILGGDVEGGNLPDAPGGTPTQSYAIPTGFDRIYIPNGLIEIKISASPGKRYAFDCRAYLWNVGGSLAVSYATYPANGSGTVNEGSDQHFLFVMDALPSGGPAAVTMTLNTTSSAEMVFYGCEISPF